MKFKSDIEIQAGVEAGGSTGSNGQVLSSTGSGVAWIDQSAISSASNFVYFDVKNETGSTILKGKGVMAVGTDGNSGHILVDEMVADGTVESKYFLGVLEEDIANGAFARVISFGQLSQFDTRGQNGETWADGQVLWCDPANNGDFTITEPDGPNVKIAAAFILNSSTNGKIQVRVQANEGIHDLHDTKITSQVDGDVLVWDDTTGVWFNDSTLNVDYTNGRVGIGTTSPQTTLHLYDTGGSILRLGSDQHGDVNKIEFDAVNTGTIYHSITSNTNSGNLQIRAGDGGSGHEVNIYTDGLFAATFDSNQRLGIGTTSPAAKLHIDVATEDNQPAFKITKVSDSGENAMEVHHGTSVSSRGIADFTNNSGSVMYIRGDGNVGIGTTSPNSKLHIQQTSNGTNNSIITEDDARKIFIGRDSIKATDLSDNPAELYIQQHGGNATFGNDVNLGGNLTLTTNARYLKAKDNAGTTTRLLGINGSNNTYIGPIDPYAGGSIFYGVSANVSAQTFYTGASARMHINATGNVGIGTTSPQSKLHISNGGAMPSSVTQANRNLTISGSDAIIDLLSYDDNTTVATSLGMGRYSQVDGSLIDKWGLVTWYDTGNEGSNLSDRLSIHYGTSGTPWGSSEKVSITREGNVGIGTTSPWETLSIPFNKKLSFGSSAYPFSISRSSVGNLVTTFEDGYNASNARIEFKMRGGAVTPLSILGSGNVGIGTTSPGAKLEVSDSITQAGILITSDGGNEQFKIRRYSNNNEQLILGFHSSDYAQIQAVEQGVAYRPLALNPNGGNVGIGTASPSVKLEIGSANSGDVVAKLTQTYERVRLNNFDLLGYDDGHLWMIGNNNNTSIVLGASWDWDKQVEFNYDPGTTGLGAGLLTIGQTNKNNTNFTHGVTRFYTNGSEKMRIDAAGNVGIGNTSPSHRLDVDGTARANNFISNNSSTVDQMTLSYKDQNKRTFNSILDFTFTGAGVYYFNVAFSSGGGFSFDVNMVTHRNGNYRNFGSIKDSGYMYWESDADFSHHAQGVSSIASTYGNGIYLDEAPTAFLANNITDTSQGTANYSYFIKRYAVYLPDNTTGADGFFKVTIDTYGYDGDTLYFLNT